MDTDRRFEKSLREALKVLQRTQRLISTISATIRGNERALKKVKRWGRNRHNERTSLQERNRNLLLDQRSLYLQLLTAMNVELSLVYTIDFALQLHRRSSGALKEIVKVRQQGRNVLIQTPKRYYKVLEAIKTQVESAQKAASRYIG